MFAGFKVYTSKPKNPHKKQAKHASINRFKTVSANS
jgi:hypothetical protein